MGQRPWWTRKSSPKWSKAQWHMAAQPCHHPGELWSPSPGKPESLHHWREIIPRPPGTCHKLEWKLPPILWRWFDGASSLIWILDNSKVVNNLWTQRLDPTRTVPVLCHPMLGNAAAMQVNQLSEIVFVQSVGCWDGSRDDNSGGVHCAWMRLGNDKQHSWVFSVWIVWLRLRGNVQGGKKKTKLITANFLDVVTQSHRRHHRITINHIAINYTCSSCLDKGWDTSPGCGHATDPPWTERQRREELPSIHPKCRVLIWWGHRLLKTTRDVLTKSAIPLLHLFIHCYYFFWWFRKPIRKYHVKVFFLLGWINENRGPPVACSICCCSDCRFR